MGDSIEYCRGYPEDVDIIREREYPLLKDTTYLDHAGTTLYAKSLIESFSQDLTSNLFGNPHSMSPSSQLSTQRVDDVRLRALRFFNADPEQFDLVFVANATAAVKLVADTLRDATPQGFWYGYHADSHTSLVGVRELAQAGSRCFLSNGDVETWISGLDKTHTTKTTRLFAYPAQSNMSGCRFPLRWCEDVRSSKAAAAGNVFTLLDAASLVSTSPLDLSDASTAPDFTVVSFYKIFGFPDLGALIVRKDAGHIFDHRRYFGGGTVDMVLALGKPWHAKKTTSIHDKLEDGTLPFHNIIALDSAFEAHRRLYGSMENISSHSRFLTKRVHDCLSAMTHYNGAKVCQIYKAPYSNYEDPSTQGAIVAFNMRDGRGQWIGKSDVEKLASVKGIQIRSGTLCNPGGAAASLGWTTDDQHRNYSSGLRCGDEHDLMGGRPTGILRVSIGAMTNMTDINTFIDFIEEFYVEKVPSISELVAADEPQQPGFYIESLSVYPIKSCGAFNVPIGKQWEVKREGLAWDREWCLVHQGTGQALRQKKYPRMTLIRPVIDFEHGVLRVTCGAVATSDETSLEISLSRGDTNLMSASLCRSITVCGERVVLQAYSSPVVSAFFSDFIGVPCTLARYSPPQPSPSQYARPSGSSGNWGQFFKKFIGPGYSLEDPTSPIAEQTQNPTSLANESPILVISRSSVNSLNEIIKSNPRNHKGSNKAVAADVFRGNIVVAENTLQPGTLEQPYIEDNWSSLSIGPGQLQFDMLGSCQRCQMVCINQYSGVRRDEPFSTLAKTRKYNGKVLFGRHAGLSAEKFGNGDFADSDRKMIMVGDLVVPSYDYD